MGADLVITGRVRGPGADGAEAIAIEGDRIVAVGTEADVRERVGPGGDMIAGAAVVPGIQDAHVHAAFAGRIIRHVNLDDLHDRTAYLDRIRAHAEAHPDDAWIVGGGWSGYVFGEGGPVRQDLDAVVSDRPVYLMNTDTHAAWVNTAALRLAGIDASTPDPWDGYYVREPGGHPTGCLQEGTAYTFWARHVPPDSVEDWIASIQVAQRELHALGITGWQDAWVEEPLLRAYRRLDDEGGLTMQVVTSLWWDRHLGMEQVDGLKERRAWGTGGRVDANTVKIMLDGCPESCTGSMLDPYEGAFGDVHGTGIQFVEADVLREAVVRLDAEGFQIHQHALGDRAFRSGLDAVEAALAANGANDHRHHIAHIQLPDPADIPRIASLGVVANIQPYWAAPDPMIETLTTPRVGERAARLYPIGDIVRSGARVAMGSDWPVTTPNPWHEMEVAVTRQVIDEPDRGALDATQRIDLAPALAAFTSGTAYIDHDDEAGAIAEGMRADLAVLDRDPFDGPPTEIHTTGTLATIAAGRVVFDRA
jgi:predicted amidohydrolase YtcJ